MEPQRMFISLNLGKSRGARFSGEPKPVLLALSIVLLAVVLVAYLATTSPSCSANNASKLGAAVVVATGAAVAATVHSTLAGLVRSK
jgi:hypothetical protein